MEMYAISVVVDGFDMDSEFQNAGLECLTYDALVSQTGGVTIVDADVVAASEVDAILQLTTDLRSINVFVVRLDPMLVSVSDIAERAGVSRETARLWTTGQRRDNFPQPITFVGTSLLWAWSDVAAWAKECDVPVSGAQPVPHVYVEAFNGAFAQKRAATAEEGWLQPKMPAPLAHVQQRQRRPRSGTGWQVVERRTA